MKAADAKRAAYLLTARKEVVEQLATPEDYSAEDLQSWAEGICHAVRAEKLLKVLDQK